MLNSSVVDYSIYQQLNSLFIWNNLLSVQFLNIPVFAVPVFKALFITLTAVVCTVLLTSLYFTLNLQFAVNSFKAVMFYDFKSIVLVYFISIFVFTILHILGISIFSVNSISLLVSVYIQPVLSLPMLYLVTFGVNSLLCLGLVQKNSILAILMNDCITLVSFFLRFLSQYIRIVLILIVFVALYEYLNGLNLWKNNSNYGIYPATLGLVLVRIVFELIDCFFILIIQFNTFFIILLWLLSFLFTLKFNNIFEK